MVRLHKALVSGVPTCLHQTRGSLYEVNALIIDALYFKRGGWY